MQEPLPGVQARHEFRRRRRDVGGVIQRTPGWPDPVLAAPELPRCSHVAPNAPHQPFVHLAHQAQRQRQHVQSFQAVLQGGYIVAHLPQIGRASLHGRAGLGGQQLPKGRLSSLNAAGKNGLLAEERSHQEVGVGQPPSLAGKPADSPVRGRKSDRKSFIPGQGRRQRGRYKSPIPTGAVQQLTMRLAFRTRRRCHVVPY